MTHRSLFATCTSRSDPPAQAIQWPSGDHANDRPMTPSVRSAPPSTGTMPMSVRFSSSGLPVGLTRNAIARESGDQRRFQT